VVVIAGEPGVGKSRLAAAAAQQAHDHKSLVLYGRCDEGLRVPYQPFAEILGSYTSTAPLDKLAAELGSSGHELGRLLHRPGRPGGGIARPYPKRPRD
jgi:hypothetical protein